MNLARNSWLLTVSDARTNRLLMAAALERSALLVALWALQVPMMEVAEVAEVPVAQR